MVLLLITDGIINDMAKTIDEIVRGSDQPMCIVIVGVGDADFSNMDKLDGDEEALYSENFRRYVAADIVQFVPFNDYKANPSALARETLQELPGQLLNFMRKNGIVPNPRTEQERRLLQQQMTMGSRPVPGAVPVYFKDLKEKYIRQAEAMGFDPFAVQDFIDDKGVCEFN